MNCNKELQQNPQWTSVSELWMKWVILEPCSSKQKFHTFTADILCAYSQKRAYLETQEKLLQRKPIYLYLSHALSHPQIFCHRKFWPFQIFSILKKRLTLYFDMSIAQKCLDFVGRQWRSPGKLTFNAAKILHTLTRTRCCG